MVEVFYALPSRNDKVVVVRTAENPEQLILLSTFLFFHILTQTGIIHVLDLKQIYTMTC